MSAEMLSDEFKIEIVEDYLSVKKDEIEKAQNKVETIQYHQVVVEENYLTKKNEDVVQLVEQLVEDFKNKKMEFVRYTKPLSENETKILNDFDGLHTVLNIDFIGAYNRGEYASKTEFLHKVKELVSSFADVVMERAKSNAGLKLLARPSIFGNDIGFIKDFMQDELAKIDKELSKQSKGNKLSP